MSVYQCLVLTEKEANAQGIPKASLQTIQKSLLVQFLHLYEMVDLFNHAANLGRVVVRHGIPDAAKPQCAKRLALGFGLSVLASDLFDFQRSHNRFRVNA